MDTGIITGAPGRPGALQSRLIQPALEVSVSKIRQPVRGVGINDAPYQVYAQGQGQNSMCPFYSRWKGVIERCYGKGSVRRAGYVGCTIDERWIHFMAFRAWMEQQPWEGNHLDKDILRPWEKKYSPDTSVFIPPWLNTLLSDGAGHNSPLPIGVSGNPRSKANPYQARVQDGQGRRLCVGTFPTSEEAHAAWRSAKALIIRDAVERYRLTDRYDERVCDALMTRSRQLTEYSPPLSGATGG